MLLTRARQGMVVIVSESDPTDPTRATELYDGTWAHLREVGVGEV